MRKRCKIYAILVLNEKGGRAVPEYEACFMVLLRYALHLNTEKLKVNRFVLGPNSNLRAKV
jgi:hypothetical protein